MQLLSTTEKKGRRRLPAGLLGLGIAMLVAFSAAVVTARQAAEAPAGRADIIVIDGLKAFGPLERAPVLFAHDKHTEALAKQNKDCLACHMKGEKYLSLKFQRVEDVDRQTVMDTYHDHCIACHQEQLDGGRESGPVTCGACHEKNPQTPIERIPIALDSSLHYRHVKASDKKCEQCHHAYNEQTRKLYYDKGNEGACLYCHKAQTEENRIAYRLAAHMQCLGCHRDLTKKEKDAGPITCSGCHSPGQQALISRLETVPRMERNQPNTTLVRAKVPAEGATDSENVTRMAVVPLDHQLHEAMVGNCRTCHHASLKACATCHTLQGHPDGDQVKLAQAMHQPDASASCVGCHRRQQQRSECAGCHAAMPAGRGLTSEKACQVCHMPQEEPVVRPDDDETLQDLAAALIYERRSTEPPIAVEDIPEVVSIGHLKDAYEAAAMPHRKIVLRMAELIKDDRLAGAFHTEATTLCQGCHHNSPASLKPPACGVCHGRTSDALNLTRPGLMAAFHEQCMQCHDRMGLEKPAKRECAACHAKRGASGDNTGAQSKSEG